MLSISKDRQKNKQNQFQNIQQNHMNDHNQKCSCRHRPQKHVFDHCCADHFIRVNICHTLPVGIIILRAVNRTRRRWILWSVSDQSPSQLRLDMNTQHSPPPCMPSTPSNHIHPSLAIFRTSTGVPSKIPPDRFQQKGGHFLMVSKLSPLHTPHETIKIKPVWRVERMWAIKLEPAVAGACKKDRPLATLSPKMGAILVQSWTLVQRSIPNLKDFCPHGGCGIGKLFLIMMHLHNWVIPPAWPLSSKVKPSGAVCMECGERSFLSSQGGVLCAGQLASKGWVFTGN